MLRTIAIIYGILFIFLGVAGFFPGFQQNGLLFGYLSHHSLHNLMNIVIGVIAIMTATSYYYSRLFFQIFGVVYAIVAIVGFVRNGDLFFISVNMTDNFLHVVLSVIALYLGFFFSKIKA